MRVQRALTAAALVSVLLVLPACNRRALTDVEKARLDSLDATGAVQAFFGSGEPVTELYLSAERELDLRTSPEYKPENERIGGVDGLVISDGGIMPTTPDTMWGYDEPRRFYVQYSSRHPSVAGEPAGRRNYVAFAARHPKTKVWRVVAVTRLP